MCKTNQTTLPNIGRFLKALQIAWASVVLGLLCSLPVDRASAQPCTLCPSDATDTAIGTAFGVFVIRNGVRNVVKRRPRRRLRNRALHRKCAVRGRRIGRRSGRRFLGRDRTPPANTARLGFPVQSLSRTLPLRT